MDHDKCDEALNEAVQKVITLLRLIDKGTENWGLAEVQEWEGICQWLNQSKGASA